MEVDRERRARRPPGDDRWGHRWRRGVFGAMRGWAAGSLGAIIFMIAACARHFDVVDEVGDALGFLPRAQACFSPHSLAFLPSLLLHVCQRGASPPTAPSPLRACLSAPRHCAHLAPWHC